LWHCSQTEAVLGWLLRLFKLAQLLRHFENKVTGIFGCGNNMTRVSTIPFGQLQGRSVECYRIVFPRQLEITLCNYGAIITALSVPDRRGQMDDVVLGYDQLDDYRNNTDYFGAVVGRYGNRIAGGAMLLDGERIELACNNDGNHLHGGDSGFDRQLWQVVELSETDSEVRLVLGLVSADGDGGYPGTLTTEVCYTVTATSVAVQYRASTDRTTVVNLTQHSYFNLAGGGNILMHRLQLDAGYFLPIDQTMIPTGEQRPVAGTVFDFRQRQVIGPALATDDAQLTLAGGFDHCWVLPENNEGELRAVATLSEATSGRLMRVLTTEPGIQFYSGNFLNAGHQGKGGRQYRHRGGLCLETQHFPNSPNEPGFPSTVLRPGQSYRSETVFQFGIEAGE
jgi:aldose 1-epimerase